MGAAATTLPRARAWNAARAAHLLRRAGFGGPPREIERLAALDIDQAVAQLVDFERVSQTDRDFTPTRVVDHKALRAHLQSQSPDARNETYQNLRRLDRWQIEEMRAWWLRRMVRTPRPFEERMTLFWHGYFTTGYRKVRNSHLIYEQNVTLRRLALAPFSRLLRAVSRDPAMLKYLDNASNRKQSPNENYARELLELFTLGAGNYSERDIKAAARAFTGWTVRDDAFVVATRDHDDGQKTFLGETGAFDGDDIIRIILKHDASTRFLAHRILRYFHSDPPADSDVTALATVIRAEKHDLRAVMRTLFTSELFYAPGAVHARIKSPVDLVVGTVRLLEAEPDDIYAMTRATRGMGQELFQPPNVKGWDGGREWINPATVFTRYNFASALLAGTHTDLAARMMGGGRGGAVLDRLRQHRRELADNLESYPGLDVPPIQLADRPQRPYDPTPLLERHHLRGDDEVLNHFVDRLLQLPVDPRQRKWLKTLVTSGPGRFDAATPLGKQCVVSLINALLTMPEYQVA